MTLANAGGNLARYSYVLGAAGNRTQVTELSGRTVNYVYDDLYRLTSETIANSANNGAISYQFDAVGNRLQRNSNINLVPNQTSTFDANDRINSDTFDANGNTKVSNGKTYNYDFENRLTSTSDGVTVVYDGDGNRVSKTVGGIATKYLVDTNNLTGYAQVAEEIVSGQVTKQYTYGHDLICQRQTSGTSFYNYDGHGSVRGLSSSSGSITDTYTYDAFGDLIAQAGNTSNLYLYAGEQFDAAFASASIHDFRIDGQIISLRANYNSGGYGGGAGLDLIRQNSTGSWFYALTGEFGRAPLSVFQRHRGLGLSISGGVIVGMNDPSEMSGSAVTATIPSSIARLLGGALFSENKAWGAMTQLAKRNLNSRNSDLAFSAGLSSSGPTYATVGLRSNSFTTLFSYSGEYQPADSVIDEIREAGGALFSAVEAGMLNTSENIRSSSDSIISALQSS